MDVAARLRLATREELWAGVVAGSSASRWTSPLAFGSLRGRSFGRAWLLVRPHLDGRRRSPSARYAGGALGGRGCWFDRISMDVAARLRLATREVGFFASVQGFGSAVGCWLLRVGARTSLRSQMAESTQGSAPGTETAPAPSTAPSASEVFAALPDDVLAGIGELGWTSLMPVQTAVIPYMLANRDLFGAGAHGSGRRVLRRFDHRFRSTPNSRRRRPWCWRRRASWPTRLPARSSRSASTSVCAACRSTAASATARRRRARRGRPRRVGTPGRILDHLGNGRLKLEHLKFFVLDEADELLSLGFWPDMREIERYLPPKERRQTCLFSATMPEKVAR